MNATLESEHIVVDWSADDSIDKIGDYVERYKIILWDHAFYSFFVKSGKYSRLIPFLGQEGCEQAMQRCIYRYLHSLV